MQPAPQPPPNLFEIRAQWILLVAQVLAISVHPFIRVRFGERYFGFDAALVLLAIPAYSICWEHHDLRPLFWFMGAYLVAVARAKVSIRARAKHGDHEHSFYGGYPLLSRVRALRHWPERRAKALEPLLVVAAGVAIQPFNLPLGTYFLLAGVAMRIAHAVAERYQRVRMLDMRDAYIEQTTMAERFRRGDWN